MPPQHKVLSVRPDTGHGGAGYAVSVRRATFPRAITGGQLSELRADFIISEKLALNALIDSIENEKPSSLIE